MCVEERRKIYVLQKKKLGIRSIARLVGRDISTISRELARNSTDIGYLPDTADEWYKKRRTHRQKKFDHSAELKDYVVEKMYLHWSPEQIAGRMKQEKKDFYASHETIYQFVYSSTGKELSLYPYLRYRQAKRGQIYGRKYRSETIADRISIHDRSNDIDQRIEPGHFEGDLTFFHGNRSANLTVLVDRMTRFTLLAKNTSKQSDEVIERIINALSKTNCKSITFDNGTEFVRHTRLRSHLGVQTYFCDPGSPWQKGTVENTINRLHRYIPKGGNILEWSDNEIQEIASKLNHTPRKILGFLSPFEVFCGKNQSGALQT